MSHVVSGQLINKTMTMTRTTKGARGVNSNPAKVTDKWKHMKHLIHLVTHGNTRKHMETCE